MNIRFNSDNIKKLKNKKVKLCSLAVSTALTTTLLTGCNRLVFDTKYVFDKALILGDDTSIIMDITSWKDYEGEQLQFITKDNFVLLSSSFDTNCFYGDSKQYSIDSVARGAITNNGEIYQLGNDNGNDIFNKNLLDTKWYFNKSIIFNGNKALILPIYKWRDYEGEQIQVITQDGLVLILSIYNSKLCNDEYSALTAASFANYYIGSDGLVTDLSDFNYSDLMTNYDFIDTKFGYNKAIILKDDKAIIVPVSEWGSYEGEQIQIKITNGPIILTATYDTILLNDTNSSTKAIDIAKSLVSTDIIDYTEDNNNKNIVFNETIIDLQYGYSNAIISNDNSATALSINKWCDYDGEQIQIALPSGDVILTSSMLLDLVNGGNNTINASVLAKNYVSENGKIIDNSNGDTTYSGFNTNIIDTQYSFKYALKVLDGNVTILPLKKWNDFYNEDEETTNCEQLQLILPDGTVIVTTAYDTVLVKNTTDINTIAEMFRGPNGKISDLTKYVGEPNPSFVNFTFFDTKYHFSHAILTNDSTAQLFEISSWLDFSEGEQLQINMKDNGGILTSFVNTTLVSPKTEGIEEVLIDAFSGDLEKKAVKTLIR